MTEDNRHDIDADAEETRQARSLLAIAVETVPADSAAVSSDLLRGVRELRARRRRTRSLMSAGAAVAAAVAVVAAVVIALPQAPAGRLPHAPVMAPAPASLTAATVLNQAARAAGSRSGGWPDAQYWYSEDQYVCGGLLYTDKTWVARHGDGVIEKTGPANGPSNCTAALFTSSLSGDQLGVPYTWAQLYALPTDPAALKARLIADAVDGQSDPWALFEDIESLLTDTPAPPALLAALFKVEASIPGARVTGRYTDALGRTGIAISRGRVWMVVDTASGEVIDEDNYGAAVMYVTEGPAASEPQLGKRGAAPASTAPASPPAPAGI